VLSAVALYSYIVETSRRSYRSVRLSPFIGVAGRLQGFVIVMRRSAWTRDEHCKVADIGCLAAGFSLCVTCSNRVVKLRRIARLDALHLTNRIDYTNFH
jgi:hypothetical protein